MAKKRPTLDAFLNNEKKASLENESEPVSVKDLKISNKTAKPKSEKTDGLKINLENENSKSGTFRYMLYLPLPVYDQIQSMVFEEQRGQLKRRKTHDYLLDAIDLLFKKKGLKSIKELTEKK